MTADDDVTSAPEYTSEPAPEFGPALDRAAALAKDWLDRVPDRPIGPVRDVDEVKDALGRTLPDVGRDPVAVIEHLARSVEPGLMASQSARFYGWVIGGTYPAGLAADWLVSAWDQNSGMRATMPGTIGAEELAGEWLLDLLGLPASAGVGLTTGATMANFSALAAARHRVLADAGWDVETDGLAGAPRVRVLAGAERHGSVDLAVRYLGLGAATLVGVDDQGRVRVDEMAAALRAQDGPTIVLLQAGNIHSGAFDDVGAVSAVAHERGAWVHVDGAFGLWAAASPRLARLTDGLADADSWATDAHKTLNTPYDCGIAVVRDVADAASALGVQASYLAQARTGLDPFATVPEMSRRARGVPVWATLASLGREGAVALVDRLVDSAAALAAALAQLPGIEVLNEVVYTQVCVAFGDDATTAAVAQALRADGTAFASSSRWHDREVLRFSVSNRGTDAAEVARTVDAVRAALAAVG